MATDLRASAAWCWLGSSPEGTTEVLRVYHLDRGYEPIWKQAARSRREDQTREAMTRPIILALPKGRILEEAAAVFARAGHDLSPVFADGRKLVFECGALRVLVLAVSDVPTYVAHGAADAGVAGSDVLDEEGRDLYEPLDSSASAAAG